MPILIIDGHLKLTEIVLQSLQREGLAVDVAGTLQGGSRLVASRPYDLIILEMKLPDGLGTTLLKQLRDLGDEVPILIISALCDLQAKIDAFGAGADDYVCKPFELAELSLRVKAILSRSPTLRGHVIKLADLQIDRIKRRVRRAGGLIRLSPTEFSLLEHLAINHGQILSRATIVDRVWGKAFKGKKNIVDVYIRQLRLKIDENFEPKLIQTIRGSGYSIGVEGLP